jgi:isochorismate hydrolase
MTQNKYQIYSQNSLLILIDFQSSLASAMDKAIYKNIERNVELLISACHVMGIPILVTEQYSKGLGSTVETIKNKLGNDYKPIEKLEFNFFDNTEFVKKFKGFQRDFIIVAGIEAHVCVLQSVLALLSDNKNVHVIRDAVCSRYKTDWASALNYMGSCGAVVTTTETAIFQLLQKAGTKEFKALSPLIRDK